MQDMCKNKLFSYSIIDQVIQSVQSLSHVWFFETPWTVAHQAPLSMSILKARILGWVAMHAAAAAAKLLQSCLTLCDPIDSSPPGSPVPGILQARTLEWVAISFSNAWKWNVKVKSLSRVWPSATAWTAAFQAPPSMGFSRQEYWSGLNCFPERFTSLYLSVPISSV